MGKLNTISEKKATLRWAKSFRGAVAPKLVGECFSDVKNLFEPELKKYFSLAALSRSKNSPNEMVCEAHSLVFQCRVTLEGRIAETIALKMPQEIEEWLFSGSFYGFSKKQGTSVRMPLTSCHPTKLCAGGCYAHDVLDAAPASVIRGAVNGLIADRFEKGGPEIRSEILDSLSKHTRKAVNSAQNELKALKGTEWKRRPYIRFSHVGEITAFPSFANALAKQVNDLSEGNVDCVVYTRHSKVQYLDPKLWIINFTLDQSSQNRKRLIPKYARTVFSAFGGEIDPDADVNFLEHHRWTHLPPIGEGRVCPATAPETTDRSCDGVQCNRCFVKPMIRTSTTAP